MFGIEKVFGALVGMKAVEEVSKKRGRPIQYHDEYHQIRREIQRRYLEKKATNKN